MPPAAAGAPGMGFMPGYAQSLRGLPIGGSAPGMPGGGAPAAAAPYRGPVPPGGGGGGIPRGFPPGTGSVPPGTDIMSLLAKGASGGGAPAGAGMHGSLLQPHQLQQQLHPHFISHDPRSALHGFADEGSGTATERLMSALLMANGGGGSAGLLPSAAMHGGSGGGMGPSASSAASRAGAIGLGVGSLGSSTVDAPASSSSLDGLGMLGLLSVIKLTDRDVSSLALGTDLTTLGLNLNAADPLYTTFDFPWGDAPAAAREPPFPLPACYKMPQPALKTGHLQRFDSQTLIYIFYTMPRDVLQAYAAQELHAREWRYHVDHKLWFKLETEGGNPGSGTAQWMYWDVNVWEKRVFTGATATLTSGFLAEEEARVKVQAQS